MAVKIIFHGRAYRLTADLNSDLADFKVAIKSAIGGEIGQIRVLIDRRFAPLDEDNLKNFEDSLRKKI